MMKHYVIMVYRGDNVDGIARVSAENNMAATDEARRIVRREKHIKPQIHINTRILFETSNFVARENFMDQLMDGLKEDNNGS